MAGYYFDVLGYIFAVKKNLYIDIAFVLLS
jgi:hypothetical protein